MAQTSVPGLAGVWAGDGVTTIPPTPIAGTTYRDPNVTEAIIRAGAVYDAVANSANFNQFLYVVSLILEQMRTQGILTYANDVDYTVDAIVLASNGNLYKAKVANGPGSTVVDPAVAPGATWTLWPDDAIRSASTTESGVVELATIPEAQAGTDAEKAVTPLTLANVTATTDRRGLLELATQAETTAGTDTERAITPATLAAALTGVTVDAIKSISATGENGGFLITFTDDTTTTIFVNQATTTTRGVAEVATNTEVQNGTAGTLMVTPAALATRTATETRTGLIEIASSAEARLSDTSRAITPGTLHTARSILLTATRTTTGNWSITGLRANTPLYIWIENISGAGRLRLNVLSGTLGNSGKTISNEYWQIITNSTIENTGHTSPSIVLVPSGVTITVHVSHITGTARAYQA
jgi:hypothetical protein